MAIRERKGRAKPWQCYWNNPFTGKRECANFATRLEAEKQDSLIKHRLKFDRESFRKEEVEKDENQELTLEQAYLLYLREKQFNKKSLSWQMDAMRLPLSELGKKPVGQLRCKDFEAVMALMKTSRVKEATVRGRMSVLRTVMRWCAGKEFCEPVRFPKLPPARYERFIPPTREELDRLLQVASPHIARVIILGSQFGVRVGPSELFKLTWDNVNFTGAYLRIPCAQKNPNAPWREVPIRESLLPLFKAWRKDDMEIGAEYLIHVKGHPLKAIQTAWEGTLRRANIARRIRPYDLRHYFATELIARGVDIGTVAKLMGHSTPTMILQHYQYVLDSQKKQAMEALPEIEYVPKSMCPNKKGITENQ